MISKLVLYRFRPWLGPYVAKARVTWQKGDTFLFAFGDDWLDILDLGKRKRVLSTLKTHNPNSIFFFFTTGVRLLCYPSGDASPVQHTPLISSPKFQNMRRMLIYILWWRWKQCNSPRIAIGNLYLVQKNVLTTLFSSLLNNK